MALTSRILLDNETNFVLHLVGITELTGTTKIVEVSTLAANTKFGVPSELRLMQLKWTMNNHQAAGNLPAHIELLWDATTDVVFQNLTEGQEDFCYRSIGGISNNAAAGKTGDVNLIVADQTADYTLTLYFRKKFA